MISLDWIREYHLSFQADSITDCQRSRDDHNLWGRGSMCRCGREWVKILRDYRQLGRLVHAWHHPRLRHGFAPAPTELVKMGMRILNGRKEVVITLCGKVDWNWCSGNDMCKEVPARSMSTIIRRLKTRVIPYRYEAGTLKFASVPDELRLDPTGKSYFGLICALASVT